MQTLRYLLVDILRRVMTHGLSEFVINNKQIDEYGIVYAAGIHPEDATASSAIACGVICAIDFLGVVVEPMRSLQRTGQHVRIPWSHVGFVWSLPMEIAIGILAEGEQPHFVN